VPTMYSNADIQFININFVYLHKSNICIVLTVQLFYGNNILINILQLELLRNLRQRDIQNPQSFMADNIRPLMPLNRRTVRTNINFVSILYLSCALLCC
jgi:hypothetical protein